MKKRIFIVISCLLVFFTLTNSVNAQKEYFPSNIFEDDEQGYDSCIKSGYSARECIERCKKQSYNLVFDWDDLVPGLKSNDIAHIEKVHINSLTGDKDFDDDDIEDLVEKAAKEASVDEDEVICDNYDPDDEIVLLDFLCGDLRAITWKKGMDQGKAQKGLLRKPGERYHYFIWYGEGKKSLLHCQDKNDDFDFECDMRGSANDFVLYLGNEKIGPLRKFDKIYDPEKKSGWLDAVIQKIADYGEKKDKAFEKEIKVCVDPNSVNLEDIFDMKKKQKWIDNHSVTINGKSKKGCINLGTVSFEKKKNPKAETTTTPRCYSFLHPETSFKPFYNTTVWTDTNLNNRCGFKSETWSRSNCKNSDLHEVHSVAFGRSVTSSKDCTKAETYDPDDKKCYRTINITYSGYNGVADYYEALGTNKENFDPQCENFQGLHIIYRVIVIAAPILVIFFVSFDLVRTIIAGDEKQMSKFRSSLVKRIVALILLILIPVIVRVLVGTLTSKSKYNNANKPNLIRCMVIGNNN